MLKAGLPYLYLSNGPHPLFEIAIGSSHSELKAFRLREKEMLVRHSVLYASPFKQQVRAIDESMETPN
jgi:hypothetical protein